MTRKTSHPILALDPGLRDLGHAVLKGRRLLNFGVLGLRTIAPSRRPHEVALAVQAWTRAYRPRTLVLEQTANQRAGWLRPLYRLVRTLGRFGVRRRLTVASYSPKTVRKTVLGNGWATKHEVAEALCARYPQLRVYLTHDRKWKERYWQNMFDAVALALHHQTVRKPPSRSRRYG